MPGNECSIRPADIDSFGHVNNAVYVSLLEQALETILGRLGYATDWSADGDHCRQLGALSIEYRQAATLGETLAAGFVVFQMRHDTQFYAFPRLGDHLRLTNRLVDVHRLRGTWLNEIHRRADGRLLARNYSTGVFLDLSGRPASPPAGMMDELRYL